MTEAPISKTFTEDDVISLAHYISLWMGFEWRSLPNVSPPRKVYTQEDFLGLAQIILERLKYSASED